MPPTLRELLIYSAASAAALALDISVFTLSLHAGINVPISACLGFSLGLMLVYTLSTRHAFTQHRLSNRSNEFWLFAMIGMAGLLLTEVLLWFLVQRLGLLPLPAKLATACVVFLFNFVTRKALLFTARSAAFSAPQ
jgi:putative flippase GtrA